MPDVETAGRPEVDIAEDSWRNYLMRNASQVVDAFGGQYKSHLVCNECGNTSIVFDPFTSVSVPSEEEQGGVQSSGRFRAGSRAG